jgi:hexosaminidase
LEGGLAPNAAVMSWRGIEGGIAAARQKHNVVMTPTDYCYFDYYQSQPETEPLAIGGYLPLEKVYSYEPVPKELNPDEQKYVIGVQANQWTEYIATPELVEYMTIPRLCALAEVAWSPKEKRDWEKFQNRMSKHYNRLDELDINYRWPSLEGLKYNHVFIEDATVNIVSRIKNTEIRYTTDGSEPSRNSLLYTKPIKVTKSTVFKFKEFKSNGQNSPVYEACYTKEKPQAPIVANTQNKGLNFEFYKISKQINSTLKLRDLTPTLKGEIEKFVFPHNDELLADQFGIIFKGYIIVPSTEVYSFSVLSDDGSRLLIDDKLVVNNDGLHGAYEKSGEIALKAGQHKIELLYFQTGGGKALKVSMSNNEILKTEISKEILSH